MSSLDLFKHNHVKKFFLARFISNFGNGLSPIALAFGILHLPGGSANELGLVLGSTTLAMLVMSPFGGVLADKFGRIRVVALADIWGSLGLFVQAGYFFTGHVPLVVMLIANINFGLMWGIFWPAMSGVMPALLPEEKLQQGNAVQNLIQNGAMILGAAVGGVIVSAWGSSWALTIDAATFLIAGLVVFSFRHVAPDRSESQSSMLDDLLHGWKVFFSYPWIVTGVCCFSSIVMIWSMGENVLGPLIALKHFNGPKSWSLVLSSEAVGYVVGSLIAMKIKVKYPMRFLTIITLTISLYMWTLARPQSIWFIAAAAFAWGVTLDLWSTLWTTAMQRQVPPDALSRVSSIDAMGTMLLRPLGLALGAPLAAAIGISRAMEAGAALTVICILAMILVPDFRNMKMPALNNSQETFTKHS